ncbi:MAG: ABC transporter permease [Vicinamibacteraceae bacterium]
MRRVRYLMWKEVIELMRDERTRSLVLIAPVLQLTLLGYAATTDVHNIPLAVVDQDRTAASRELVQRFDGSAYFTVKQWLPSSDLIDPLLERGDAWIAITIPPHYGADIARGVPVTVQAAADGSDANSSTLSLGYASALVTEYARELARASPTATQPAGITPEIRVWFNPELESRLFFVPGVLALVLLVITTTLSSMAIVREKEQGTLEQLNVTPLARWELIVGKLMPYAVIGFIDVCLVLAIAVLWFQVPLRGSVTLLFLLTMLYVVNTLAIGLLVSTISSTQQQAMMTAMLFFLMPMVYLSGFVFPIENMPAAIQKVTYAIPLRYYLEIVRGIFLKGVGLDVLWPQAVALAGTGVGLLTLAMLRSSKRSG